MNTLNPTKDGLAIFASGLLQYVTNETDRERAYQQYATAVGFDTDEHPMDADHISFRDIPADEMAEWQDADAENYPAA